MGIEAAWESELMWAAGFFDGEGHCGPKPRGAPRLNITQRHREPLERFLSAFGVGKIYDGEKDGRPLYKYAVGSYTDVQYVTSLLRPRVCSIKRDQMDAAWAAAPSPQPFSNRGKKRGPMPEETKRKISLALTGRKRGPEFSATMRRAWVGTL